MQNKPLDLAAVNQAFRALAQRKGWQAYHTPKNLAAAISVEAAELLEIFQWLTDEQSRAVSDDPATRQQVADEAADIVMYIIELCVGLGIDLPAAITHKINMNDRKHAD